MARLFILLVLGGFLVATSSNFLRVFSDIRLYDWGSLTLVTLYYSLDAFIRCCRQTFTGATYLLEVFFIFRIFLYAFAFSFMRFILNFLIDNLLQTCFYEVIGFNTQFIALKDESVGDFCQMYRWRKSNRQLKKSLSLETVRQLLNGLTSERVSVPFFLRLYSFNDLLLILIFFSLAGNLQVTFYPWGRPSSTVG